jgi:parallel beta-helix repeat protein
VKEFSHKYPLVFLAIAFAILTLLSCALPPRSTSDKTKFVSKREVSSEAKGTHSAPYRDLQFAIDQCSDGDTLVLLPGKYSAEPDTFTEPLCGNCENHRTPVKATRGFLIQNKSLNIIATHPDSVVLETNAGYGILFVNSGNSCLTNLTITGGKRDLDGSATDGAIVVKSSQVTIKSCKIIDNTHRPDSIVVGIGGIIGREGANIIAVGNTIRNNGWDGIALYRGANAYISGNTISQGRGAGIGITWDATATAIGNEISEYWKGIGSFGASTAIVKNNIVRDCLGWGIIATGNSYLDACNNVVYHNGNCGMATWSETAHGRFSNNIIALNGWKEQWVAPRVGLQNYGGYKNFKISYNDIWGNFAGNYGDMPDLTGKLGNISLDPQFQDLTTFDFRLKPDSPCIDKGNPLISDIDGSISDIGLSKKENKWF